MSQKNTHAGREQVAEAEALIRSLAGVANARVHASESGIDAIHVDVTDPERADHVSAHVRSALLAGLATPVTPARIHVRVVDSTAGPAGDDPAPATPDPGATDEGAGPHEPAPRHRIRLVQDAEARDARTPDPVTAHAPPRPERLIDRPRLVAVDLDRTDDGRVLCTVTVAFNTDVRRADAVAVDLPGAAAQAAAQATVRALVDAGLHGLELDGLREVEIAGRDYTVVALRRSEHYTRVRSGSAPITGAPERAAAQAAVDAARTLT